jgi:hypothetical protein
MSGASLGAFLDLGFVVGFLFGFGAVGFLLARSVHRFRERQRAEWLRLRLEFGEAPASR